MTGICSQCHYIHLPENGTGSQLDASSAGHESDTVEYWDFSGQTGIISLVPDEYRDIFRVSMSNALALYRNRGTMSVNKCLWVGSTARSFVAITLSDGAECV